MANRTLGLVAVALVIGLVAPTALACWDNTDAVVVKLKKMKLTTEQLKDIFVYVEQHREVVKRAHSEGLGCRYHENHDAVFEKQAVGVLTDSQFRQYTGRTRTKIETLTHENRLLKKKVARLEKRVKALEAALKKAQNAAKRKAAEKAAKAAAGK